MQKEVRWWINNSQRRQVVLIALKQPMTAKQLALITKLREDCCSHIFKEFSANKILICLNPKARRSRLYWLTDFGKKLQKQVLESQGLPIYNFEFPLVDWELYGWICYSHRMAVIKALTEPLQPAMLRRKIAKQNLHIRISANNVSDILRTLCHRKIVVSIHIKKRAHRFYELTELGKKLQRLLLEIKIAP